MFDSELKFLGEIRWQSLLGFSNKSVSFSQLVSQSVSLGPLDKNTAQLISIVSPFFAVYNQVIYMGLKTEHCLLPAGERGREWEDSGCVFLRNYIYLFPSQDSVEF